MPISHVSLPTGQSHYKEMRDFYVSILSPLGYSIFMEIDDEVIGLGPKNAAPDFWLHCGGSEFKAFGGDVEKRGGKTHVAFQASSVRAVDEWYQIAMYVIEQMLQQQWVASLDTADDFSSKKGGTSNGKPGERAEYTKGYYAAYVIDPLGNNIEVMHWSPLWLKTLQSVPYAVAGIAGALLSFGFAKYNA